MDENTRWVLVIFVAIVYAILYGLVRKVWSGPGRVDRAVRLTLGVIIFLSLLVFVIST